MALRTKENLQKLFQASRERNQKKKEQLKQEKYKLNLQIQKVERAHLKTLVVEEKKRKMEQLQALAMKASHNQNKQPSETCHKHTYPPQSNKYIQRYSSDENLYLTREELMAAEERGEGAINWELFDKLTNEFKERYCI